MENQDDELVAGALNNKINSLESETATLRGELAELQSLVRNQNITPLELEDGTDEYTIRRKSSSSSWSCRTCSLSFIILLLMVSGIFYVAFDYNVDDIENWAHEGIHAIEHLFHEDANMTLNVTKLTHFVTHDGETEPLSNDDTVEETMGVGDDDDDDDDEGDEDEDEDDDNYDYDYDYEEEDDNIDVNENDEDNDYEGEDNNIDVDENYEDYDYEEEEDSNIYEDDNDEDYDYEEEEDNNIDKDENYEDYDYEGEEDDNIDVDDNDEDYDYEEEDISIDKDQNYEDYDYEGEDIEDYDYEPSFSQITNSSNIPSPLSLIPTPSPPPTIESIDLTFLDITPPPLFACIDKGKNLALKKPTLQSSTARGFQSSFAVDGDRGMLPPDADHRKQNRAQTKQENNPWWQVDLGHEVIVDRVIIFNKTGKGAGRLADFHVFLISQGLQVVHDKFREGKTHPITYIKFPKGSKGRFIRLEMEGENNIFNAAEVEVYGTPQSRRIENCLKRNEEIIRMKQQKEADEKHLKEERQKATQQNNGYKKKLDELKKRKDKNQNTYYDALDKLNKEKEAAEKVAAEAIAAVLPKNTEGYDWGEWTFYDGGADDRPEGDYCGEYPNRDVPEEEFPENSWQADTVYVNHFVDQGFALINRARDAIYAEYGYPPPRTLDDTMEVKNLFRVHLIDVDDGIPDEARSSGGWSTKESMDGLSRRLLHAIMTNDEFTVVMGGHSAAAGHGNHFKQSYMMQFHEVMEPIMAFLGVKLITRNQAQGGLGTFQTALGSRSLYGDTIDVLLWDTGMTEKHLSDIDLFYRQALLGSTRPPFLLCNGCKKNRSDVLKSLHRASPHIGIGEIGSPLPNLPITTSHIPHLPNAVHFLSCDSEMKSICRDHKYRTTCWIDRPDVTPITPQKDAVGGTASWHPGFREHRLTGRVLAMWFLRALEEALTTWMDTTILEGNPLPDHLWHVTEMYEEASAAVRGMKDGFCETGDFPDKFCQIPFYGRTEYTPRNDPEGTSLRSVIKGGEDGFVPESEVVVLYEGEDVYVPTLKDPEGEVDVVDIVKRTKWDDRRHLLEEEEEEDRNVVSGQYVDRPGKRKLAKETIIQGQGWSVPVADNVPGGFCDGSFYSRCGRGTHRDCLLSGHNDGRGFIIGDGLSGWLVMTLTNVKEGVIILNSDFYHGVNMATEGWTTVGGGNRNLEQVSGYDFDRDVVNAAGYDDDMSYIDDLESLDRRYLKPHNELRSPDMVIDYAIDGKITTLTQSEYDEMTYHVQRLVSLTVFLDDPNYTNGETKDVEFAIRVRGCERGNDCSLAISHLYWA